MDARDRLRLYLEQRRELGESELVLDALPVDDVLRMLTGPRIAAAADGSEAPPVARPAQPTHAQPSVLDEVTGSTKPVATDRTEPVVQSIPGDKNAPKRAVPGEQDAPHPAATSEQRAPQTETTNAPRATPLSTNWRDVLHAGEQPVAAAFPNVAAAVHSVPEWLRNIGIPIGLTAVPLPSEKTSATVASLPDLESVASVISGCRACPLGLTALNAVPGEGHSVADFVCVGEAPGQTEDETGRPFVGAAGQLLTKILAAIQLQREEVFICNVLKHRPPGNRNPAPDEVRACTPYLTRQLELLKPKVILALGTFAAQTLLNTPTALGKLRGSVHSYQGIPLIVTYHPAALLRNESWKRPAWDDVKLARRILDASRAAMGGNA